MRKLVVHRLTPAFREGVHAVPCSLPSTPSDTQLFVRVHFAGINASDVNASAGRYTPGVQPPFDIGFEAVGEVTQAGTAAVQKGFRVGSHVAVLKLGCFAEMVLADVATNARDAVYPIDRALPGIVPMLIGGLTSSIGLEAVGEMRSGETVLVTGASGGTGLFAVQLAALAGCRVIGTCGSDDKMAVLRELGCERPIQYKTEDMEAVLRHEYPDGIDLVFEGVGGRMLEICKRCLHPARGRLVSMGFSSQYGKKDGFESADAALVKSKGMGPIRGFLLKDYPSLHAEHLGRLQSLVASGKLKSVYDPREFVGLDAIADAVEYLQAGRNVGKPVVRLCDLPTETSTEAHAPMASQRGSEPAGGEGPPVGSMARVRELQSEAFAEDVALTEEMVQWTEARLERFFESGGISS